MANTRYDHYIQMVVRGTVFGQQWQIAPCWVVTGLEGGTPPVGVFDEGWLLNWFTSYWTGPGLDTGLAGAFAAILTGNCTLNEVRVYARTETMDVPVQLVIAGNIDGTRGAGDGAQASFNAWSCYARADRFGQRGAAFRFPGVRDIDQSDNMFTETALDLMRAEGGLLDRLSRPLEFSDQLFYVMDSLGSQATVEAMAPAVVKRVHINVGGFPDLDSPIEFPYESDREIWAFSCSQWQVHDYVSSQTSRKFGRGR